MQHDDGSLTLPQDEVLAVLNDALVQSRRPDELGAWPGRAVWAGRAAELAAADVPKTYLASLLTALTATAVDARVDALSLQKGSGPGGYSAASVARHVHQFAARHGIDVRGTGPVPFNNSPFTGKRRVSPDWENVKAGVRHHLARLVDVLHAVDALDEEEARLALAVVLEQRPLTGSPSWTPEVADDRWSRLLAVAGAAEQHAASEPEGGRRGQALVAAVLGLGQEQVKTQRVNDPSRVVPGDVEVGTGTGRRLLVEVRQKTVTGADVTSFAGAVAEAGERAALVVALVNAGSGIDVVTAAERVEARLGLPVTVVEHVRDLLRAVVAVQPGALVAAPARLAADYARWLLELGAAGVVSWQEQASPLLQDEDTSASRS